MTEQAEEIASENLLATLPCLLYQAHIRRSFSTLERSARGRQSRKRDGSRLWDRDCGSEDPVRLPGAVRAELVDGDHFVRGIAVGVKGRMP
jgi:hypothetical protein